MAEDHARDQTHDNTCYSKADALKEPDSKVIGGVGGKALRVGSHLNPCSWKRQIPTFCGRDY